MFKYFNIIKKNSKIINYYTMGHTGYYVNTNIINTSCTIILIRHILNDIPLLY